MKKRQRFLSFCCVLFSCLLLLSGCGNEVTEYWDEDKVYGGGHTENNIYGTNYVLYVGKRVSVLLDKRGYNGI